MADAAIMSIDIGSTWTKGALFGRSGRGLSLLARHQCPTTQAHLADGFRATRDHLRAAAGAAATEGAPIYVSSSAKGGLAIAAIGLVPEFTLEMARLAALSAGGKVVKAFSFKLTEADVEELVRLGPDIVLLAGGTDGGNEEYVLHNARLLAHAPLHAALIYAGNRAVAGDVARLLAGHDLHLAENLLPEFNQPNPDPARAVIRDVFLRQIIKGKGLDEVVAEAGRPPKPTPLAMLELVGALHAHRPEAGPFCAIDLGGATTDVYSCHADPAEAPGVIRRGLPEPVVKRTVEGDLGLRVSARAAAEVLAPAIRPQLDAAGLGHEAWDRYLAQLATNPGHLPATPEEEAFDLALANACAVEAVARHCGRERILYTPDGERRLRHGKDLRPVTTVIGTGGYLARRPSPAAMARLGAPCVDRYGETLLWPESFEYRVDTDYVLPLLGNLAEAYPEAAARAALEVLRPAGHVRQGVVAVPPVDARRT